MSLGADHLREDGKSAAGKTLGEISQGHRFLWKLYGFVRVVTGIVGLALSFACGVSSH